MRIFVFCNGGLVNKTNNFKNVLRVCGIHTVDTQMKLLLENVVCTVYIVQGETVISFTIDEIESNEVLINTQLNYKQKIEYVM